MLSDKRREIVRFAVGSDADNALEHIDSEAAVVPPGTDAGALSRAKLAENVAILANDNYEIATRVLVNPEIKTTRDVALTYNAEAIADMVFDKSKRSELNLNLSLNLNLNHTATTSLHEAQMFQRRLFHQEPTAVLQRMVTDNEIPIHSSPDVRKGVAQFLDSQAAVNVRRSSLLTKLQDPEALHRVDAGTGDPNLRGEVVSSLRLLQTTQALVPSPEAIAPLLQNGMTSAMRVSSMSASAFVAKMGPRAWDCRGARGKRWEQWW